MHLLHKLSKKKNKKMIGIGNSNDKKLYVNKSGALNLIKKAENSKNKEKIISNTFSNYNLLNNNKNNSKKKKPKYMLIISSK